MAKRRKVLICLAAALLCFVAVGIGVYWIYTSIMYTGREYAMYDDMHLVGSAKGYWCLVTGDLDGSKKVARLFVRLPDGAVVLLQDLDEQLIADLHRTRSRDGSGKPFIRDEKGSPPTNQYLWRLSGFGFADGRLTLAVLASDSSFEISSSENGPFCSFPIDKSVSEQLFGKPNEIKKQKLDIKRAKL